MSPSPQQPASPTWYDVLGVGRDASADEIKAAWRQATDRFEPGSASGQFRMYNEAADILLDPERRQEYDASLGVAPGASRESVADTAPPPPVREELPPAAPEPPESPVVEEHERAKRSGPSWEFLAVLGGLNVVVLGVLAVLTVAVLVAAAFTGVKVDQTAKVAGSRDEAPAAAERAVKALFSYDYRELDANRERAEGYLTDGYAKEYLKNFDALKKQKDGTPGLALQTKAVVAANVQGSGVVDVSDDGAVARVLVFVNVVSRQADGDPRIFQNRVAMTMKQDGDRWLVDKVTSY